MSDSDLVESVECSAVSKSLKSIKSRCFNVVGCSTLAAWFHKKQHRR
ncbi:general secretion pathway protein GspH [Vibrio metoecus]|nr:general secretion pathway protein GspH [Vibrio metoecus]